MTDMPMHDLPWEYVKEPLPLVRLWPRQVTTIVYRDTPPE